MAHTNPGERRASSRTPRTTAHLCLVYPSERGGIYPGYVADVSAAGVGLLTREPFLRGERLTVDVGDHPLTFRVRVVRAEARPGGDWAVGCAFTEGLDERRAGWLRDL